MVKQPALAFAGCRYLIGFGVRVPGVRQLAWLSGALRSVVFEHSIHAHLKKTMSRRLPPIWIRALQYVRERLQEGRAFAPVPALRGRSQVEIGAAMNFEYPAPFLSISKRSAANPALRNTLRAD